MQKQRSPLGNIPRFFRSVWHTPLLQLLHRLRLKVKRTCLVFIAKLFPFIRKQRKVDTPKLSNRLPQQVLSQHDHAEYLGHGRFTFHLLNTPKEMALPIQWHLPELNTGTRLWKLHFHYFDYTAKFSGASFETVLTDWIKNNRPYAAGYWLDSWNSYSMSIRLVSWMGEYERRKDGLSQSFQILLQQSIAEQLVFLQNNLEVDILGNHIVKNIKALYWGSQFFTGHFAKCCSEIADRLLKQEMDKQILSDGFHFERSPAYHCQVFGDLMDCWRCMDPGEMRDDLAGRLHLMAQVTVDLTHPNGEISLFNDGGTNMTWSPNELIQIYQNIFGKSPIARKQYLFKEAGYFVARTPDYYLVFDIGKVGPDGLPAHAHGDIFAYELSVGLERIFVDAGVYEYNQGEKRTRSRATASHNTLTLNDCDQCEFWGAFRMGRRAQVNLNRFETDANHTVIEGEHTGYRYLEGTPTHRRALKTDAHNLIHITDTIVGGKGQNAVSRLLLHPDVKIKKISDHQVLLTSDTHTVKVTSNASMQISNANWWPDFGIEIKTKSLLFDYGDAPGEWSYTIEISRKNG